MRFRDLVSGRQQGFAASLARGALGCLSLPYGWAVAWRNRQFDLGRTAVYRAAAPVLSIGNITVGGTGKTPMVVWTVRRLLEWGFRPAILSRGYGARDGRPNDEALMLQQFLPDTPHWQDRNRSAAARQAVEHGADVLVLDDGLQHRRLARDLDVVLLDALEPFGYERLLPRGLLREPLRGLRRAAAVVLTRSDQLPAEQLAALQRRVADLAPGAVLATAVHRPLAWRRRDGQRRPLDALAGVPLAAFCGVGNPAGFQQTLSDLDLAPAVWREFPDHHPYSAADWRRLQDWAAGAGAELVCTQKDLVKLPPDADCWALEIEMAFTTGDHALRRLLRDAAQRSP